jgi:hypothetical protein
LAIVFRGECISAAQTLPPRNSAIFPVGLRGAFVFWAGSGGGPSALCGEVVGFGPVHPEILFAGSETRGFLRSDNNGKTWKLRRVIDVEGGGAGEEKFCVCGL